MHATNRRRVILLSILATVAILIGAGELFARFVRWAFKSFRLTLVSARPWIVAKIPIGMASTQMMWAKHYWHPRGSMHWRRVSPKTNRQKPNHNGNRE